MYGFVRLGNTTTGIANKRPQHVVCNVTNTFFPPQSCCTCSRSRDAESSQHRDTTISPHWETMMRNTRAVECWSFSDCQLKNEELDPTTQADTCAQLWHWKITTLGRSTCISMYHQSPPSFSMYRLALNRHNIEHKLVEHTLNTPYQ